VRREQFSTTRCGELVVLRCRDELDIASAPRLHAAVARAEAVAPEVVLVDLREVTFLDSAGFHALDDAVRRLERLGAWCGFADPESDGVRRALDLCDLAGDLRRWPTVADALRASDARGPTLAATRVGD
jgi:anti-anti-sigma factor